MQELFKKKLIPDRTWNDIFREKIKRWLGIEAPGGGDILISPKIINMPAPSNDSDAATKKYVDDAVAGAGGSVPVTFVVAASDSEDTSRADYVCPGSSDEDKINEAISDLPSGGGCIVLLEGTYTIDGPIQIDNNTILEGCGTNTVITIPNSTDSSMNLIENVIPGVGTTSRIVIKNLKLNGNLTNQASGTYYGIYLNKLQYSSIHNVEIIDCTMGIYTGNGGFDDIVISNCYIDSCDTYGIYIDNGDRDRIVNNRVSNSTTGYGIRLFDCTDCIVQGNISTGHPYDGIELREDTTYCIVIGNHCSGNDTSGISLTESTGDVSHNVIANNICEDNDHDNSGSGDGIRLSTTARYNLIIGNRCRQGSNQVYGINLNDATCQWNKVINNDLRRSGATANFNDGGLYNEVFGNIGTNIVQRSRFALMKNTSGATINRGDVVVLKAVAAGNEVTTTTTQGDDMIFGMFLMEEDETTAILNNEWGIFQILGKTTFLKVDGTTDIAIGDFLGTFTTAGIAMKAAAGDMAFAIALEAYTTDDSNGVIDAILITPRKI